MEVDRISDLPDNVTDEILSCLPIKDAVKTSVLSTKWRCKWETLQSLVFSSEFFPPSKNDQGLPLIDKLVRDIDCLLLLHSGPLLKFELSYFSLSIPANEINKWIRHVSRHPLKEFSFWIPNMEAAYKMPSCLFSCHNLTDLDLTHCFLRPPSAFKGFKNLKSLKLWSVTVAQDVLECLVSASPVLTYLNLHEISGLSYLDINAPNLESLYLSGDSFVDIGLKNYPHLQTFSMHFEYSVDDIQSGYQGNFDNLVQLLDDMPRIRDLCIEGHALGYWARGNIPRELPVHCFHLDHLAISVNFTGCDETSALVCLLRSVPNLQTLQLDLEDDGSRGTCSEVWEVDQWTCSFTRLRLIQIDNLESSQLVVDFLKFLLSTTPVLERIVFSLFGDDEKKNEIQRELCPFKCLSPTAKVICE